MTARALLAVAALVAAAGCCGALPVGLAPGRRASELPLPGAGVDAGGGGVRVEEVPADEAAARPPPPREPPAPPAEPAQASARGWAQRAAAFERLASAARSRGAASPGAHPGYDARPAARRDEAPARAAVSVRVVHRELPGGAGNVTGYLAVLENPRGHLSFRPGAGSGRVAGGTEHAGAYRCATEDPVAAARRGGCEVAFNGGFFDMGSGQCLGAFVHGGQELQEPPARGPRRASFGIDREGNLVAGYVSREAVRAQGGGFEELLQGKGWLVRDGNNVVGMSRRVEEIEPEFVTQRAPRTGIGYDESGRVLLFQVDGREDLRQGPNLPDFADLFASVGAVSAVNLDGGGSSVTVLHGEVASKPRCDDTSRVCARNVPTIVCVS